MAGILIIVTGCAGCGKTSFTKRLCKAFPNLKMYSYDTVKERVYDQFGYDDPGEKAVLDTRSLAEFWQLLDSEMAKSKDLVIEYPFCKKHVPMLSKLIDRHQYRVVTVLLQGDLRVLYERGMRRDQNPDRHPGHLLNVYHKGTQWKEEHLIPPMSFEEFERVVLEKDYNIQLGDTVAVDTTDIYAVDFDAVINRIESLTGLAKSR